MKGLQFVLHVSLVFLQAHHHQCQSPITPQEPIIKGKACETFDEGTFFRTECVDAKADELRDDFDEIAKGGKRIIDLMIRESDISNLLIHKDFLDLIKKLQLDSVTLGDSITFPDFLSKFTDVEFLMVNSLKEKISLNRETFLPRQPIKTLILGNNRIRDEDIDSDAFDNIKESLQSLTLRENELTHLPSAVIGLTTLLDLDLSGNAIRHFSDEETNQLRSLPNLARIHLFELECQCDQLRGNFFTYAKEKNIKMLMCSPLSQFQSKSVLEIDVEEACKTPDPESHRNPNDRDPNGSKPMKVAVIALIVTVLPFFLK